MHVSLLSPYFVAGALIGLQAMPVSAQETREPVFQVPELVGQVERVSVSPAEIVVGGKRFEVSQRIKLTRNGVNEFASFAEIAAELQGRPIAYGLIGVDGDRLIVDRILLRNEVLPSVGAPVGRGE